MTAITIRNLDEGLEARLRQLAARNGHSMEEEARQLLRRGLDAAAAAAAADSPIRLTAVAASLFGPEHGVELDLPGRSAARDVPVFAE